MSFGSRLRELRKLNNLTQAELAKMLNVTRQSVTKWENDYSMPQIEYITRLSELFKVSYDYLVSGIEKKKEYESPSLILEDNRKKRHRALPLAILIALISLIVIIIILIIIPHFKKADELEYKEIGFYLTLDNEDLLSSIAEIKNKGYLCYLDELGSIYDNSLSNDGDSYYIDIVDGHSLLYVYKIYFSMAGDVKIEREEAYSLADGIKSYEIEGPRRAIVREAKEVISMKIYYASNDNRALAEEIYLDENNKLRSLNIKNLDNNNYIRLDTRFNYFVVVETYRDGSTNTISYYKNSIISFNLKENDQKLLFKLALNDDWK